MFHQALKALNVIKRNYHKDEFFILKLVSFVVVQSENLSVVFLGHIYEK